jgi:hypothetical protein
MTLTAKHVEKASVQKVLVGNKADRDGESQRTVRCVCKFGGVGWHTYLWSAAQTERA